MRTKGTSNSARSPRTRPTRRRGLVSGWVCAGALFACTAEGVAPESLESETGEETGTAGPIDDASSGGDEGMADASSTDEGGAQASWSQTVERVRYRLAWDTSGVEARDEGGFALTNALGYRIEIDEAYLTSYSISLVPCGSAVASPLFGRAPADEFERGHSGESDPSALEPPRVEDLRWPSPLDAEAIEFEAATYCQVHYLSARSTADSLGLPEDDDYLGASLRFTGRWERDGVSEAFSVRSGQADGRIYEIEGFDEAELDATSIRVHVIRDLGHLFDGVDFQSQSELQMGQALLTQLTDDTRVEIESIYEVVHRP